MRDCKYSNSVAFINLYSRALNIFMILIIFGTCSLYTHPLCISSADSALMWLTKQVQVDSYAYLPANTKHSMISDEPTTVVIFERRYNNFMEMLQFYWCSTIEIWLLVTTSVYITAAILLFICLFTSSIAALVTCVGRLDWCEVMVIII